MEKKTSNNITTENITNVQVTLTSLIRNTNNSIENHHDKITSSLQKKLIKTLTTSLFTTLVTTICLTTLFIILDSVTANQYYETPVDNWENNYSLLNAGSSLRVGSKFGFIHFWDTDSLSLLKLEQVAMKGVPVSMQKDFSKILPYTLYLAEKYRLDPIWILSIMYVESKYQFTARSNKGARGPMQLMPSTSHFLFVTFTKNINHADPISSTVKSTTNLRGPYRPEIINQHEMMVAGKKLMLKQKEWGKLKPKKKQLIITDPFANIELGIIYLKYLSDTFECPVKATIAYNMGPGWVKQRLDKKLPLGNDNTYLRKVRSAYEMFSQNLLQ